LALRASEMVAHDAPNSSRCAGIVGGGSIGVAFAVTFARAQWSVRVFDPSADRRAMVRNEVLIRLEELSKHGILEESPDEVASRVQIVSSLEEAVANADLIEECAPELTEVKRELFTRIDKAARADAVLATASSFLAVSKFVDETLPGHQRCLVAHPGNPPYLIPVVEIVPAPFTSPAVTERAITLFSEARLKPVLVNTEIEGFIFNRIQGAVLREVYCLVRDGVATVDDIDTIMRDGLGMRWSFMGPFETVDLNTRGGIRSHAQKMGPSYARMGAERGQDDPWTEQLVARVESQRRAMLPLDEWEARISWRDKSLMRLIRLRLDNSQEEKSTGSAG
jgi:L-gulonate 3-dehydrogenase